MKQGKMIDHSHRPDVGDGLDEAELEHVFSLDPERREALVALPPIVNSEG